MHDEKTNGVGLQAFMLGALVGAGVGLLLAPRPGAETRRQIADLAHKAREKARALRERARPEPTGLGETARRQMNA